MGIQSPEIVGQLVGIIRAFLVAQVIKILSAMQETWVRSLSQVRKIPWRREWQPTPVFLYGEFYGQRGLVGYSPQGCKESDTTEQLTLSLFFHFSFTFLWHHGSQAVSLCLSGGS